MFYEPNPGKMNPGTSFAPKVIMDRPIKKKTWTAKRIFWISLTAGFLGFCFYQFVLGDYSIKLNVNEERLTIATVHEGPFQEYIPVIGSVIPKKTISKIYPEVSDGRFEIDMEFNGLQPEDITRGQTLHIRLELGNLSTAMLLPQGGFYQKSGGQWVYVVDKSREFAVKRKIDLGRQNPEVFEVLFGLQPGEHVITSSYDNYGDNIDKLILK